MPRVSKLKKHQQKKAIAARSARRAYRNTSLIQNATLSSIVDSPMAHFDAVVFPDAFSSENLVDLGSSEEYESVSSDDDDNDDDFQENEDELENVGDSIVDRLFAVSAASFERKGRPVVYTGNSKRTQRKKNEKLSQAAAGSSKITQFFRTINEDSGTESKLTKEENINKAIKFVNGIMLDKTLSKTQIARYTAVLYFFRLRLNNITKIEAAKTVSE